MKLLGGNMKIMNTNYYNKLLIKKIITSIIIIYFVISMLFYVLAGEQLHFRSSRGNINSMVPTDATIELIEGASVSETFINKTQVLESFAIEWGDYRRINQGKTNIILKDLTNDNVLFSINVDFDQVKDGQVTKFELPKPVEGLYNHEMSINIIGLDGVTGSVITPLMTKEKEVNSTQLYYNNESIDGTLCFSVQGKDYIWLGIHYWEFILIGGLLLIIWGCTIIYRFNHNKKTMILNIVIALRRYRFLIEQMVARDFKTKYKRSVLGIFWSFLNPLLMMLVQYFVFSNLFKQDVPYYHVYLLIGVVMYNFFSEACGMTLSSILGNANLMTKVYVPKYIYPLARVVSSTVNLLISLIPLLLIILFSGITITKAFFLAIFGLICLVIFSLGLGLLLSTAMVFFRDTQFLWGVITMVWMYATPIFYPESILPKDISVVLHFNPLYYYINFVRSCIINGVSPEPTTYFICIMSSLVMFGIGAWVFRKNQDKFIFYL